MRLALQVVTGTMFLAATVINVTNVGFTPGATCSLISGFGFFISTMLGLADAWKSKKQ